jgi:hypothetical protein
LEFFFSVAMTYPTPARQTKPTWLERSRSTALADGLASLTLLCCLAAASAARAREAPAQWTYFGIWPHHIAVFDAVQEKIVGTIDVKTDVPRNLLLSADKKKLYLSTLNDNSIVIVDLTTGSVASSFKLDSGNRHVRLQGWASDPGGELLYGLATVITKQIDHYDVGDPQFVVIDLPAQKIVRTAPLPKDLQPISFRNTMRVSPDGKLLYLFRENITVFDASSFQVVKKIDLAKPQAPGIENVSFFLLDDPNDFPGKLTSVFFSSDPYVHRRVFGIGVIDLATLAVDFSPLAPEGAADNFHELFLTPDRKIGYTVAMEGGPGNLRCQFWAFDMASRRLIRKGEFPGRTRFYFGLSADGTKILIYGAGYQVEVYDAQTFALRSNVEVPGDITTNMIVLPLASAAASAASTSAWSPAR